MHAVVTGAEPAADNPHAASPRFALVIANGDYRFSPLGYATDNALRVAAALTRIGFDVTTVENRGYADTAEALDAFVDKIAKTKIKSGMAMVYFVGRAVQLQDDNWLLPLHLDLRREHDVRYGAISQSQIVETLAYAGASLNLVVLDVVTGQPLAGDIKPSMPGLASPRIGSLPANTMVAMAGRPGDTIPESSVFGHAWARYIEEPGLPLEQLFNRVRADVAKATGGLQVPQEFGYLTIEFAFSEPGSNATPRLLADARQSPTRSLKPPTTDYAANDPAAPLPTNGHPAVADPVEKVFWDTVKESDDTGLLQSYIDAYPQGVFAENARERITTLSGQADDARIELAFWQSVADSQDPGLYQAYLDAYPNGRFAVIALRLKQRLGATPGGSGPGTIAAATTAAAPTVAVRSVPTVAAPSQATTDPQVSELLAKGRRAFKANRLTSPREDNALAWAKQVLAIDTDNPNAKALLRDVVGRYQGWAGTQLKRGSLDKAEANLNKAKRLRRYATASQRRKQRSLETQLATKRQIALAPTPPPSPPKPKEESGFWQGLSKDFKDLGCTLGGAVGQRCEP